MKSLFLALFLLASNTMSFGGEPPAVMEAPAVARSSRYQLSFEALGAGLIYSVYGSYWIGSNIVGNAGLGFLPAKNQNILEVPLSASYLAGGDRHFFEALLGANLDFGLNYTSYSRIVPYVIPEVGICYRYWPAEGGLHARAMFYVFGPMSPWHGFPWPLPWVGFSLG